ncbi:MAG TPA: cytidylate kinase family protein [Verrucomicrobiae bacterium]
MGIITISRGSFSGGKAVAEQLAKQLGQPALSREEVLSQAAREFGISEEDLAESLNQPPPFWRQVLGKRLTYVKCVTAVLLDHVRQGGLIYHGHVGHLLLAGVAHVLRVRVISGAEQRIRAAMESAGLERAEAIAHIQRVDRERSRWAQVLYGVNWEDPAQYDLVLNLERVSVASASETILRMSELEDFKPSPASRKKLEDLSLSCRVWAAMAKDPNTRDAGLEVTAEDGHVVLKGKVGSTKSMEAITQAARLVPGVKSLRSEVDMGSDWHW